MTRQSRSRRNRENPVSKFGGLLFKQLSFRFDDVGPALLAGLSRGDDSDRRRAPTMPCRTSFPERPIQLTKRDYALESQARELLGPLGASKLGRDIRVEWHPRLRTCAGRADYREKLISLNPLLLHLVPGSGPSVPSSPDQLECKMHSSLTSFEQALGSDQNLECNLHSRSGGDLQSSSRNEQPVTQHEVERTFRHELAHLLAQWRAGRRRIAPHGAEWRRACRDLGIAGEARCHNLPFAARTCARRYVYRCPNCREEFPRARKIRRAIACLACCRKHNRGDFDPRFRLKLTRKL